jgi:catechol 2,3-dioxygenase-like lactoylglutathione lyase family enzyme
MLAKFNIYPTLPAGDLRRARKFYAEKLGFNPISETPDSLTYQAGNSTFLIYQTAYAGTAQHTLAALDVDDLDAVMVDLRSKGVIFEEYDYPDFKTVNGVAQMGTERVAWFKDSEGNIIAIGQANS